MLDTVEQVGLELGHLYIAERLFKSFSAKNWKHLGILT
jgi:hypothetical protein